MSERKGPIDAAFDLPPWTQEEDDAARAALAAQSRGDMAAANEHMKKIRFTPGSLVSTKRTFGADYIRERGYNTDLADRFLGPGWLDRDD